MTCGLYNLRCAPALSKTDDQERFLISLLVKMGTFPTYQLVLKDLRVGCAPARLKAYEN